MSIVDTGGTFLGCLKEKNGYFNFFPIAQFVATGLHVLTREELDTLFYGSSQKGRNLWFPYQRESDYHSFLSENLEKTLILDVAPGSVETTRNDRDQISYRLKQRYIENSLHELVNVWQDEAAGLAGQRESLLNERSALIQQRETLMSEVDSLIQQREALTAKTGVLAQQKEALVSETTALVQQKETLTSKIAALTTEKDAVESSLKEEQEKNRTAQQEKERLTAKKSGLETEVRTLTARRDQLKEEYAAASDQAAQLQRETKELEKRRSSLDRQRSKLEAYIQETAANPMAKLGALQLDSQLADWMQQAGTQKQLPPQRTSRYLPYPSGVKHLEQELCRRVQEYRPAYSPLDILNIAVCLTQGFLTVFYGAPGCGKTSICNIFAGILGLKEGNGGQSERYVPVSVERGWMSKRDFIGYFNPLTRTFDSSNRQIYDALRLLDGELEFKDENGVPCAVPPFLILLDEANLSSMEYYWADFMNLCEDSLTPGVLTQSDGTSRLIRGTVNLGEVCLEVPDWLRFAATINADHTTEILSPRLIDRAWLVSLPDAGEDDTAPRQPEKRTAPLSVTWPELLEAFGGGGKWEGSGSQKAFREIVRHLQDECGIAVSHRVRQAVRRYWSGASRAFGAVWSKKTPYENAGTAALDYAIAQRVLPQLQGSGPDFAEKLDSLKALCESHKLDKSAAIVQRIQDRGAETDYFQFF